MFNVSSAFDCLNICFVDFFSLAGRGPFSKHLVDFRAYCALQLYLKVIVTIRWDVADRRHDCQFVCLLLPNKLFCFPTISFKTTRHTRRKQVIHIGIRLAPPSFTHCIIDDSPFSKYFIYCRIVWLGFDMSFCLPENVTFVMRSKKCHYVESSHTNIPFPIPRRFSVDPKHTSTNETTVTPNNDDEDYDDDNVYEYPSNKWKWKINLLEMGIERGKSRDNLSIRCRKHCYNAVAGVIPNGIDRKALLNCYLFDISTKYCAFNQNNE